MLYVIGGAAAFACFGVGAQCLACAFDQLLHTLYFKRRGHLPR